MRRGTRRLLVLGVLAGALLWALPVIARNVRSLKSTVDPGMDLSVSAGWIPSFDKVYKFGFHTDIDNAEESIWEGASFPTLGAGPARCPADTSAFTLFISSDNAADTEVITVQGLDANWKAKTTDVTLAGLTFTQVGSALGWMRINRAFNAGTSDLVGVVYLHIDSVDAAVADGIPDTPATDIKTVINAGENQTLQACYSVADGMTAYLERFCVSNLGAAGGDEVTIRSRYTPTSGVGRVQAKIIVQPGDHNCEKIGFYSSFGEQSLFEITAISTGVASNQDVSGTFRMMLVPN